MINSQDAVFIYKLLVENDIPAWLTGGWGIAALLGEQTRPHKDLDVIVLFDDLARLGELLSREGFSLKELWSENRWVSDAQGAETATAFVLHDLDGREIDVHAMRLDEQGNGIPAWDFEGRTFTRQDVTGKGRIAGLAVCCLLHEAQLASHTGYELPDKQRGDLELLHKKFSIEVRNAQ